jgi:hypothetical protein
MAGELTNFLSSCALFNNVAVENFVIHTHRGNVCDAIETLTPGAVRDRAVVEHTKKRNQLAEEQDFFPKQSWRPIPFHLFFPQK